MSKIKDDSNTLTNLSNVEIELKKRISKLTKSKLNSTESACAQCIEENLVCPKCPLDYTCIISVRTCEKCPTVACLPKTTTETDSNNNITDNGASNMGLIIGLTGGAILVVFIIIVFFAKRLFKKKVNESFHYTPKNRVNLEKGVSTQKKKSKGLKKSNTFKFNLFGKGHSSKMSTSFSMLNFDYYDNDELEEEMSFGEMLKTNPKKCLAPRRPTDVFKGKTIPELSKLNKKTIPELSSKETLVNEKSDLILKERYGSEVGNLFQGFDISFLKDDSSASSVDFYESYFVKSHQS